MATRKATPTKTSSKGKGAMKRPPLSSVPDYDPDADAGNVLLKPILDVPGGPGHFRVGQRGPRKVKTMSVRLRAELRASLEAFRLLKNVPVNKIINQAVAEYVDRETRAIAEGTKDVLAKLRRYREVDPDFDKAIRRTAEAESKNAANDPVEGVVVQEFEGPATKKVRSLLAPN
jgi:hypothetical protein